MQNHIHTGFSMNAEPSSALRLWSAACIESIKEVATTRHTVNQFHESNVEATLGLHASEMG